ncbi:MAG: hypothetical protein IPN78_17435 [Candidatus Accumulibacter sp.]|nr:hypothetical protein [Candidatus Accumulibacter propinquus]
MAHLAISTIRNKNGACCENREKHSNAFTRHATDTVVFARTAVDPVPESIKAMLMPDSPMNGAWNH